VGMRLSGFGCLIAAWMLACAVPCAGQQGESKAATRLTSGRDYQVPAGTLLSIELRTAIASDSSQPPDPIRGVLSAPLTFDGVELVPAGATVIGTITDAAPALRKTDRARLAFRFNVLEHPETGSRVPLKTEIRVFEVEALKKGEKKKAGEGAAAFNQVRFDPGASVYASLREPFVVRIPDPK
jgi:hypothetical protein